MRFNSAQKVYFIALLQAMEWQFRDETIYSPSGGLWFSNSHFEHWSPSEVHEIFTRIAARIAKARVVTDWEQCALENRETAWAAEANLKL
jgi:hypothetical protein